MSALFATYGCDQSKSREHRNWKQNFILENNYQFGKTSSNTTRTDKTTKRPPECRYSI